MIWEWSTRTIAQFTAATAMEGGGKLAEHASQIELRLTARGDDTQGGDDPRKGFDYDEIVESGSKTAFNSADSVARLMQGFSGG